MLKQTGILLLVPTAIFLWGCQLQTLKCPNGEPVVVTRIDYAYPVYASGYEAGLKATIKRLNELEIGADATLKQNIVALRDKLNQESSQYQDTLKTAVLGLQTTPCDQTCRTKFWETVAQINQKGVKLNEAAEKLSKPAAEPGAAAKMLQMLQ